MNKKIDLIENSVHEVVSAYLINEGFIDKKNEHAEINRITFIAKTALDHLHETEPKVRIQQGKGLNQDEKSLLERAVKHVVISGKTPWVPGIKPENLNSLQKLIFSTIRGNFPGLKELFKVDYIKCLVWKQNKEILKDSRNLINQIFVDMDQQIKQGKLSDSESFHMEMIIGDLLSLYPYLGPESDEILQVPVRIAGNWKLVPYTVEVIPFTPNWMGSPLTAVGLKPPANDSAPPLFLFKGTTYPADFGFGLSLLTDINPFASVGKYGFKIGREKISHWLKEHTKNQKARIYGKSLGGSLAMQAALACPKQTESIFTFGAPEMSLNDLRRCKQLEERKQLPLIHRFWQEKDPVTSIDRIASSGINYYHVLGKHSYEGVRAHAEMYSTHETSTILRMNPNIETRKWKRLRLTILRAVASVFLFPLLITFYAAKVTADKSHDLMKHQIKILDSYTEQLLKISVEKIKLIHNQLKI